MINKKHIFITALITFVLTSILIFYAFGGGFLAQVWSSLGNETGKLKKIETLIDNYFIYEYDKEEMTDIALSGFTYGAGDPYTMYIDKESFDNMKNTVSGDYVGIGVEVFVDEDDLITVITPFDHSPAQKAGIRSGDKIVKVDGVAVDASNYNEAVSMIKGVVTDEHSKSEKGSKANTEVVLTVKRGGEMMELTVIREKVVAVTVTDKMLENHVGYIRISNFGDKTGEEFRTSLGRVKNNGAQALVIDLRANPGGTLESLLDVADLILPEGNIITIKDKNGNEKRYDSDTAYSDIPLCVLINSSSASAAEALAGAVADSKRGTLVGEKSFGKGSVQTIFELGDGTALKVTTAKYYTPGGTCIDKTGITPHEEVLLPEDVAGLPITVIPYEKDTQLKKAEEILLKK